MKRTLLFFLLIASVANAFLTAPVADANDPYIIYGSEIDGVGLWSFENNYSDSKNTMILKYGEHPEFALYCDGKNRLCFYEKGQQCFVCKTVSLKWDDEKGKHTPFDPDRKEMLKVIDLAKKDRYSEAGEKNYGVLLIGFKDSGSGELYTVSKKRLVKGKWTVSLPTKEEIKSSAKTASDNQKKIRLSISEKSANYKSDSLIGYSDKRIRKIADNEYYGISIKNSKRHTVKISARGIDIIIVPTLFITDEDDCNIISTVVLKKNDVYTCLGHISGSLRSVGADIDSDGVPELMTQGCLCCDDGSSVHYFKIYPVIKELITWSSSG